MLNLSTDTTEAMMRLVKCMPRRDGAGIVWDLELSMEVPDQESAELVNGYLPGALAVYHARESSKGDVKTSGGFDLLRVKFYDSIGTALAKGHCEVKAVLCKAHAQQAVLVIRLRVFGLLLKSAMDVVEQLDEQVTLNLSSAPLTAVSNESGTPETPNLTGSLIVYEHDNGNLTAGIVVQQNGSSLKLSVLELDQDDYVEVEMVDQISTSLQVRGPNGEVFKDLIFEYIQRCANAERNPSWRHIVNALAIMHASGELEPEPDGTWVLTAEVWETAFSVAQNW